MDPAALNLGQTLSLALKETDLAYETLIVETDDSGVGDRDAEDVAGEVVEHVRQAWMSAMARRCDGGIDAP